MRLPRTTFPEVAAPSTFTPFQALPEITLPAPESAPTVLPVAPSTMSTPCWPFGTLALPFASVPMRARETVLLLVPTPSMRMPVAVFPEITFWEPAAPPTVLPVAELAISMPRRFGTAAAPAAFVPMRFPCTRFPVVPESAIRMPSLPFPEIRFRYAAAVPPMMLLSAPARIATPWPRLASASVPSTFAPMVLPSTRLSSPASVVIWIPSSVLPEMRFGSPARTPPIRLPLVWRIMPVRFGRADMPVGSVPT